MRFQGPFSKPERQTPWNTYCTRSMARTLVFCAVLRRFSSAPQLNLPHSRVRCVG
jgi:hypothetical protein